MDSRKSPWIAVVGHGLLTITLRYGAVTLRDDELHDVSFLCRSGHLNGQPSTDQWPAASMTTVTRDLSADAQPSVGRSVISPGFFDGY